MRGDNKNGSEQKDIDQNRTPITLSETGFDRGENESDIVEPIAMTDVERELFMNEKVRVLVHKSPSKFANPVIVPSVNGINQPVIRGVAQDIKRKYVEAILRSIEISYTQRIDPMDPSRIEMVPQKNPSYPMDVISDTPRGAEWKRRIEMSL